MGLPPLPKAVAPTITVKPKPPHTRDCARIIHAILNQCPTGKFRERFLPHLPIHCPCRSFQIQSRFHILFHVSFTLILLRGTTFSPPPSLYVTHCVPSINSSNGVSITPRFHIRPRPSYNLGGFLRTYLLYHMFRSSTLTCFPPLFPPLFSSFSFPLFPFFFFSSFFPFSCAIP